jgi:hypothetical protein
MDKWIQIDKVIDYYFLYLFPIDYCSELVKVDHVLG